MVGLFKAVKQIALEDNISTEKLAEGEHDNPPKGYPKDRSLYAVPEYYEYPLDTPKRTRAAITYFDKHKWRSEEEKKEAAKTILKFAKKYGISVSNDTNVYKAAHSK